MAEAMAEQENTRLMALLADSARQLAEVKERETALRAALEHLADDWSHRVTGRDMARRSYGESPIYEDCAKELRALLTAPPQEPTP